jgi:hypothetical protein
MSKELRQRLEAKRDEAIHEAAERLLKEVDADMGDILPRIEAYSKLLAAIKPPPSREWAWAIIVAVLCLSSAGLLWSVRVPRTRITLNLQSDAVELTLAAPWSWSGDLPLETSPVHLEALSVLDAPLLGSAIESVRDQAWMTLEGGSASLKQLGVEPNGVLTIESAGKSRLDVYARGAKFGGQLLLSGSVHLAVGKEAANTSLDQQFELTIPEGITFRAKGATAVPTHFQVRPRAPWILRDLRMRDLRFSQETPAEPGAVSFMPAILGGTLTLHDVSETVMLREKNRLSLMGVEGRVVDLRAKDGIDLIFEGTAQQIQMGPNGFEQNLAPTYLAYVYHQKPLAFFWGAVVFCWGVLWGIRKTIFT